MTEFNLSEKRRKLYSALNKVRLNEITIYDMMSLIRMQDREFIKLLKWNLIEEFTSEDFDDEDEQWWDKVIDKLSGDDLK